MIKKLLCLIIAIIYFSTLAFAQSAEGENFKSQQIGIVFSTLGGSGLYYILPSTESDNVKFTGIYLYTDEGAEKESYYSLGVEYQRDLVEDDQKRGYLAFGGHVDNSTTEALYFRADSDKQSYFNIGIAIGIETGSLSKGIVLNASISYQFTTSLTGKETRLGLGGGFGLGFNF